MSIENVTPFQDEEVMVVNQMTDTTENVGEHAEETAENMNVEEDEETEDVMEEEEEEEEETDVQ